MVEKYKMKTSLGDVIMYLETNDFKNITWEDRDNYGKPNGKIKTQTRNDKFTLESGSQYIEELYNGSVCCVIKNNNGLFAIIELDDSYYGCPEYYLEKIE